MNSINSSGGIGFAGLLFLLFLGLKLAKVIDWSWWWVTCPLWGGLAVVLAILFIIAIIAFIVAFIAK